MSKSVYVIGAGFSSDLGYPTMSNLLSGLSKRISPENKILLMKVIKFHYPSFEETSPPERWPNIEQLLTRLAINIEFFDVVRGSEGNLKKIHLESLQDDLLYCLSIWFDEINKGIDDKSKGWLSRFQTIIAGRKNTTIISFNWDLVLDKLLTNKPSKSFYLTKLLKPHGSLNWFLSNTISKVSDSKKEWLYVCPALSDVNNDAKHPDVQLFLPLRNIQTKSGKKYIPWIVPPTFLKKFDHPFLRKIWEKCTKDLSSASAIYFLGYSLPEADLHAQYVLHSGYHYHADGYLGKGGRSKPKLSPAQTYIVNPSLSHAQHITNTVGRNCKWFRGGVVDWLEFFGDDDNNSYFDLSPMPPL